MSAMGRKQTSGNGRMGGKLPKLLFRHGFLKPLFASRLPRDCVALAVVSRLIGHCPDAGETACRESERDYEHDKPLAAVPNLAGGHHHRPNSDQAKQDTRRNQYSDHYVFQLHDRGGGTLRGATAADR